MRLDVPRKITEASDTSHVAAALDGWSRLRIQQTLFAWWQHTQGELPPLSALLAEALVVMRRTGLEQYSWRAHRVLSNAEALFVDQDERRRTMRLAEPPSTLVEILGEERRGVVTHVVIARAREELCPAPWYVVVCPALGVCRAHGTDELEPAHTSGRSEAVR